MMNTRLSIDSDLTQDFQAWHKIILPSLASRSLFRSCETYIVHAWTKVSYRIYFSAGLPCSGDLQQRTFKVLCSDDGDWRDPPWSLLAAAANNDGRSASFSKEQKVTNCYGVNEIGRGWEGRYVTAVRKREATARSLILLLFPFHLPRHLPVVLVRPRPVQKFVEVAAYEAIRRQPKRSERRLHSPAGRKRRVVTSLAEPRRK